MTVSLGGLKPPPVEVGPTKVAFRTTHLHKLRMQFLAGEEGEYGQGPAMLEVKGVRTGGGGSPCPKPLWKPGGSGASWRPLRGEASYEAKDV